MQYFFDTSALVKYCHPERGTSVVASLLSAPGRKVRIQLAVALELASRHLVDQFVAADSVLAEVAALESLLVLNPEL